MAYLERRREPRIRSNEQVQLKILGDRSAVEIPATVLDVSGRGLKLVSPIYLRPGTLVQIDGLTHKLLGEAMWCARDGHGYEFGLRVQHSIAHRVSEKESRDANSAIQ